jgi:hypothetical protein
MKVRNMWIVVGMALAILPLAFEGISTADTACFSTHTFGSGATLMKICISQHGNLVQFESPATEEHIRVSQVIPGTLGVGEGYVVCSVESFPSWDAGSSEFGFGPSTITQPKGPNTFPLTIVRDTTDGDFRLEQIFSQDTTEKEVAITMRLTNISGSPRSAVRLQRYFDGDIGSSVGGDIWDKSESSVWGREAATGENPGLMLTALTFGTITGAFVEEYSEWNPNGSGDRTARTCSSQSPPPSTPTGTGDFVGRAGYLLGTVNAGQRKTVKFVYRRF